MKRFVATVAAGMAALACLPAAATDLIEAWRAAERNGLELRAAGEARQAGAARRDQAAALWRPSVQFTGTAGVSTSESETRGARFAAPGFGVSSNVSFDTSVTGGTTAQLALEARQPLLSGARDAQRRVLELSAEQAETEWQGARQSLRLRTAERYFDFVLAAVALRVLRRQQTAIERALAEARDRFALGDVPVTDTHEAAARSAALQAQVVAAGTQLEVARMELAEATGLPPGTLTPLTPARTIAVPPGETLEEWITAALAANPELAAARRGAEIAREQAARHRSGADTSLDLVARVGRDRLNGSGDFGGASAATTNGLLGVQLVVPLYTGGMRSAREDEALSLAARAETEAALVGRRLTLRVRAAWAALAAGAGRLAALEQGRKAAGERLAATRLAQRVGDRTTLDLLNAENDEAAAELSVLEARIDLLLDRMRLALLGGRLDDSVLQTVNAALTPVR